MIKLVVVMNNTGCVRLSRFYQQQPVDAKQRQEVCRALHERVIVRQPHHCSFFDVSDLLGESSTAVYRRYADLFFIFVANDAESPLAVVDLIQEFVDAVDHCFGMACELDFVFHFDRVNHILNEMIQGGMVMEISSTGISEHAIEQQLMDDRMVRPLMTVATHMLTTVQDYNIFHKT